MKRKVIKQIIKEEVQKKVANELFAEEFEYILCEVSMFDMLGPMISSGISSGLSNLASSGYDFLDQSGVLEGATDAFKRFIIEKIFEYLNEKGLPIQKDSFIGTCIIDILKNLATSNFMSYFSPGGCKLVVDEIIQGLQDCIMNSQIYKAILSLFFGEGVEFQGAFGTTLRETINAKLKDMTEDLRQPLVDFACSISFEDIKNEFMNMQGNSNNFSVSGLLDQII